MSIRPFLGDISFDPEATHAMSLAFDQVCETLGLARKTDGATILVAKKVIEIASSGERDPERLSAAVLEAVGTVSA
jgi:hypothetical protein